MTAPWGAKRRPRLCGHAWACTTQSSLFRVSDILRLEEDPEKLNDLPGARGKVKRKPRPGPKSSNSIRLPLYHTDPQASGAVRWQSRRI